MIKSGLKECLEFLYHAIRQIPCEVRFHDIDDKAEVLAEESEPIAIYTKCKRCEFPLRVYCEGDDIVLEELY